MNYLFPRFNCFVNSQDRISKEIMSTLTFQAFFISFLLLVFLIETSGNSISFLAVIIVDVLLVYFNYDKCYNNECIYYNQLNYITFLGDKVEEFYFMLKYILYYFTCWKIRTISSLQRHTFFIYCAIS